MIIAVSACAVGCAGLVALALLARYRPVQEPADEIAAPADPAPAPYVREEDRVRPALSETGEKIWVDEDDVVWHEIVAWTGPSTPYTVPMVLEA